MPTSCFNILLVDDNDDDVVLMTEAFAASGRSCKVVAVHDGCEALDYLCRAGAFTDATLPDLVLLDINMPCLDGFGVLDAIRRAPKLAELPVVVLTTSEQAEDIQRAKALGARDCLHKPVGFESLQKLALQVLQAWSDPSDEAVSPA